MSGLWLQTMVSKQETDSGDYYGWGLGLVNDKIRFNPGSGYNGDWLNNGSIDSDYYMNNDEWYFISGVFDGNNGEVRLYVNGELIESTQASINVNPNNSQDLKIGAYMPSGAPSGPEYFYGEIEDVSIWNVALDTDEIKSIMVASPNGSESELIGYWSFNDASGDLLTDLSSSSNDGIIYGAEWSDDVPDVGVSGSQVAATSFTPSEELQDNSLYHWQVTATDPLGLSFTTPMQTFVVNQTNDNPEPFDLLAPSNGGMLTELSPSFYWNAPEDIDYGSSIDYYEFLIHTENNFENVDPVLVVTNSYVLSEPLTEDQDYYWKVIAIDDRGGATSSATWSFWTNSINSPPAEFTLVSPEQDEETGLTPTFTWNESSDADLYDEISYTLSYGTDPSNLTSVLPEELEQDNFSIYFSESNEIAQTNQGGGFPTIGDQSYTFELWFKTDSDKNAELLTNRSSFTNQPPFWGIGIGGAAIEQPDLESINFYFAYDNENSDGASSPALTIKDCSGVVYVAPERSEAITCQKYSVLSSRFSPGVYEVSSARPLEL